MRFQRVLIVLAATTGIAACCSVVAADDFFERNVRPLLARRCLACHSGAKTGGGLSLENRAGWQKGGDSGAPIVPGKPHESLLIEAVNYESLQMPPADKGGKLPAEEIAVLTEWIRRGAIDPREGTSRSDRMTPEQSQSWWAFQNLLAAPADADSGWIDRALGRRMKERGVLPVEQADRRTLIRRITYDLTGLPPTWQEVDAFVNDTADDAWPRLVDRLLASERYGERWGRHWLDVVRYADTAGENSDRPLPHVWKYRNWVIDSLNRDISFQDFIRHQLCGDLLPFTTLQQRQDGIVATGYLAVARRYGHDIDKDIHLMHEDVIDNLGKNLLGLSIGCARCHDHKYDPISSQDYYALYGIFHSTLFSFPGCEPKGQPRDLIPLLSDEDVSRLTSKWEAEQQKWQQDSQRIAAATSQLQQLIPDAVDLSAQDIADGKTVRFDLSDIPMRAGSVVQLVVEPGASHGADTTRLDWTITNSGTGERWDLRDLIPILLQQGPMISDRNAAWCFIETSGGARYLRTPASDLDGHRELVAWANDSLPYVGANTSAEPVKAWTTLPPDSILVHPGPQRSVAVAWVCPTDGQYHITGAVSDAHPVGDGGHAVSMKLQHLPSPGFGSALVALGRSIMELGPAPASPADVIPVAYAVRDREPENVAMHQRGDPELPGDVIPRRWLEVFGGELVTPAEGSGRRQLAEWIVGHPLFARVIVNRVWHWHFGRGIVPTPNDFGFRGQPAVHPELLDRLAARFVADGYSLKKLHRIILMTDAWQRSSMPPRDIADNDANNDLVTYFSRRRLSAEEIRDSLLAASASLDLTPGGPHPFPPAESWTFSQHAPFNAVYETNQRSVFLMVQRQRRHPFLALFDGADPNSSTPARETTTVPTQALYFLNAPFFHQQASLIAARILREHDSEMPDRSIVAVFRQVYQRDPSPGELQIASEFLTSYPGTPNEKWSAWVRVILASNEFLYVD